MRRSIVLIGLFAMFLPSAEAQAQQGATFEFKRKDRRDPFVDPRTVEQPPSPLPKFT